MKTTGVLKSFLSNIVKNLKIPQNSKFNPIAQNIVDPTFHSEIQKPPRCSYHSN